MNEKIYNYLHLIFVSFIYLNVIYIKCFENKYYYFFKDYFCINNNEIINNYLLNEKQFLKELYIFSQEETIEEIIKNNKSISRYGDGEFSLIFGDDIHFQKKNKNLSKRLNEILKSNEKDLLIGLPNPININFLINFTEFSKNAWLKFIEQNKFKLVKLFDKNRKYYSSFISRFYFDFKNKSNVPAYMKKLKKLWDNKNVVLIEGEKSKLGIGNDLFDNMKSIKRIICPSDNAFNIYDKILNETLKIKKNNLILLALGPTATVLAFDLYKNGYHVIDIGHIDTEYEWFLRNATTKINIDKNKIINENETIKFIYEY